MASTEMVTERCHSISNNEIVSFQQWVGQDKDVISIGWIVESINICYARYDVGGSKFVDQVTVYSNYDYEGNVMNFRNRVAWSGHHLPRLPLATSMRVFVWDAEGITARRLGSELAHQNTFYRPVAWVLSSCHLHETTLSRMFGMYGCDAGLKFKLVDGDGRPPTWVFWNPDFVIVHPVVRDTSTSARFQISRAHYGGFLDQVVCAPSNVMRNAIRV